MRLLLNAKPVKKCGHRDHHVAVLHTDSHEEHGERFHVCPECYRHHRIDNADPSTRRADLLKSRAAWKSRRARSAPDGGLLDGGLPDGGLLKAVSSGNDVPLPPTRVPLDQLLEQTQKRAAVSPQAKKWKATALKNVEHAMVRDAYSKRGDEHKDKTFGQWLATDDAQAARKEIGARVHGTTGNSPVPNNSSSNNSSSNNSAGNNSTGSSSASGGSTSRSTPAADKSDKGETPAPSDTPTPSDSSHSDQKEEKNTPPKSPDKSSAAPQPHDGERWITVHPHGEDGPGQPVLLKPNPDGSHTIIGGAGGKLNGLRMTGVKSEGEYKAHAKQKRDEKRAAKKEAEQKAEAERLEKHKAAVQQEYSAAGKEASEAEIEREAYGRALDEKAHLESEKQEQLEALSEEEKNAQLEEIHAAADMQGWNHDEYSLSDEALAQARLALEAQHRQSAPEESDDAINARVEKDLQKIADAHHRETYRRAKEVLDNAREAILTTHDDSAAQELGDLEIGDIVTNTFGDAGKGFQANLEEQLAARGMDVSALSEEAENARQAAALDRAGGDAEKARVDAERAQKRAQAAQASRERISGVQEQLGEGGKHLEAIKSLPTEIATQDRAAMVEALAKAKVARQKARAARDAKARVRDVNELETLPTAAVVRVGKPLSHAEAMQRVEHDLAENERQSALRDLVDLYNLQEQISPLRSHRLSGHSAFFGAAMHAAAASGIAVKSPDPLMADILGASGTAHVLRRALEKSTADKATRDALKKALAEQHVESQVEVANTACDRARELLNAAQNMQDIPLDSMEGLMAATQQAKEQNQMERQAREQLGVALGRLEAAAALNEAFQSGKAARSTQVALGAVSMEDALKRAHAVGLLDADRFDHTGALVRPGHFRIHDDGKNKILEIHPEGLDHLADRMREDPAHIERLQTVAAIKNGDKDEANWLPAGISRRPAIDVSRDPNSDVPKVNLRVNVADESTPEQIGAAIRDNIAQRIEAGQDPTSILSDLRSAQLLSTQVPAAQRDAYRNALAQIAPDFKAPVNEDGAPLPRNAIVQARVDHKHNLDDALRRIHGDWLDAQVKAGKLDSVDASIHRQTLPQTDATRDLVHQVHIQDPRLQHGFSDLQDLGRSGRRAIRDYAYQHLFRDSEGQSFDPKDTETPIQALSPQELQAWKGWRELSTQAAADPESGGDVYRHIQKQWAASQAGSGGGMFDDLPSEPHAFSTVNLDDDNAVIAAARQHAQSLGYQPERRVTDLAARDYEDVVPELEVTDQQPLESVAREARSRIRGAIRDHAFGNMLGTPQLVGSGFNPGSVQTASQRWAQYVADMGGEDRAYRAVQDTMKGDFAQRFAKGYKQQTGAEWKTVATPLRHADAHSIAVLSPERRKEVEAQNAAERARAMNRTGGKFAEGGVKDKLEASREEEQRAGALFSSDTGKSKEQELATHRVTLGSAAENMVKGFIPKINLKKGTAAAGAIDMSSGDNVKRQRAIKQLEATGRVGWTLGTGAGKTSTLLGGISHLRDSGKIKRAIIAAPSDVQENFGAEAARFYDLNHPSTPTWFSDSTATPEARRAAYHHQSGNDVVVVTHHALRDDLTWALAQHRFGGDQSAAKAFLDQAPEHERDAAIQDAAKAHGWNFDMSAVDEGQALLNREGKADSSMSKVLDGFSRDKEYHVPMSADPVKNDASESYDFLRKVAPKRYVPDDDPRRNEPGVVTRSEFLRKYAVNTPASIEALKREMAPYHYAESITPDVQKFEHDHLLPMTPEQSEAYNGVLRAYQKARDARRRGDVDVAAMKELSPSAFAGKDESTHFDIAKRLQASAGIARDSALDRIVNFHPQGAKFQALEKLLAEHPPHEEPPIIFARRRAAVAAIHDFLQAKGIRATKVDGTMATPERDKRKAGFAPQWDPKANDGAGGYVTEPEYDAIVYSDCGAKGWNGQRARRIIHWDTPDTAETYRQREGRAHRTGQRHDVHVHALRTDSDYEARRRVNLESKDELRDELTTAHENIDDSGLATRIQNEVRDARQKLLQSKVQSSAAQAQFNTDSVSPTVSQWPTPGEIAPRTPVSTPGAAPLPGFGLPDQAGNLPDQARMQ